MTTQPWAIYIRVSTEDQGDEGVSIQAQEESCRSYAKARGWIVGQVIIDEKSGRNANRPGYQQLLKLMTKREVAGVLAWKLKRLSRSVKDTCALLDLIESSGCGLVTVTESWDTTTPMGRALITVGATFSQLESDDIGKQTQLAMRYLKCKGFFTGGPVPAGTTVVQDDKRRRLVRGEGADVIAQAWGWVMAGASLRDVAKRFIEQGVPHFCRGKATPWSTTGVRNTLLCAQLAGLLVTPDLQAQVRATLAKRSTPTRRVTDAVPGSRAKHPSPLAGMVRCPTCDRAMFQLTATGNGGAYRWFRCGGRVKARCTQKDLRCEPIEKAIFKALVIALQPGGDYRKCLTAHYENARALVEEGRLERGRLTAERDQLAARISELVLKQQIGGPGWAEALRVVGAEIERVEKRLAELTGTISAGEVDSDNLDLVLDEITNGVTGLEQATPDEQRRVALTLVAAARIDGDHAVMDLYEPEHGSKKHEPPPGGTEVRALLSPWVTRQHGRRTLRLRVWLDPRTRVSQRGAVTEGARGRPRAERTAGRE